MRLHHSNVCLVVAYTGICVCNVHVRGAKINVRINHNFSLVEQYHKNTTKLILNLLEANSITVLTR